MWPTVGLAICSRVVVVTLSLLCASLLPAYDTSRLVDEEGENWLAPLCNWDGVHMLAVAGHGYTHEHSFAFFPGFPLLLRLLAWSLGVSLSASAVLLSNVSFIVAAAVLSRTASKRMVALFCLSPASVFFSAAYTESCFALLVFLGVWWMSRDMPWSASAAFFLAASVRSNGILLAVPLLARGHVMQAALVAVPFAAHNAKCIAAMCLVDAQEWCNTVVPNCYSHVQTTYWSNGLFAYWKWSNAPNFLLALPMSAICAFLASKKGLGNTLVAALGALCVLSMNVQIITRLVAVFPNMYVEMAGIKSRWVMAFFVTYAMLGCVLFPTFYPWT